MPRGSERRRSRWVFDEPGLQVVELLSEWASPGGASNLDRSPKGDGKMNDGTKSVLERAFELARSGRYSRLNDVIRSLADDRYDITRLQGATLRRQLRTLIRAAAADGGVAVPQKPGSPGYWSVFLDRKPSQDSDGYL